MTAVTRLQDSQKRRAAVHGSCLWKPMRSCALQEPDPVIPPDSASELGTSEPKSLPSAKTCLQHGCSILLCPRLFATCLQQCRKDRRRRRRGAMLCTVVGSRPTSSGVRGIGVRSGRREAPLPVLRMPGMKKRSETAYVSSVDLLIEPREMEVDHGMKQHVQNDDTIRHNDRHATATAFASASALFTKSFSSIRRP